MQTSNQEPEIGGHDAPATQRRWLAAGVIGIVGIVCAIATISVWHGTTALSLRLPPPWWQHHPLTPEAVTQMVAKLEQRTEVQSPSSTQLRQLAQAYVTLGRHDEAERAFANAYQQAPDDRALIAEYAWAAFQRGPDHTNRTASSLFQRLHEIDPANLNALSYLGNEALKSGDYVKAKMHWEKVLASLPPQDPRADPVRKAIARLDELASHARAQAASP